MNREDSKKEYVRMTLRGLLISYGINLVHKEFDKLIYELISDIQEMKKEGVFDIKVPEPVPEPVEIWRAEIPKVIPMEKEIPQTVNLTKEENELVEKLFPTPRRVVAKKEKQGPSQVEETPQPQEKPSAQELKKIHKERITTKRNELKSQNVNALDLLTKEKMKELLDQNYTYWKIAEEMGLWDSEVSQKAKEYGLSSKIANLIKSKKFQK